MRVRAKVMVSFDSEGILHYILSRYSRTRDMESKRIDSDNVIPKIINITADIGAKSANRGSTSS